MDIATQTQLNPYICTQKHATPADNVQQDLGRKEKDNHMPNRIVKQHLIATDQTRRQKR